jgi:hypothetical protein
MFKAEQMIVVRVSGSVQQIDHLCACRELCIARHSITCAYVLTGGKSKEAAMHTMRLMVDTFNLKIQEGGNA